MAHEDGIRKLIKKYERQMERCRIKENNLEARKANLSVHGYWDLGYFGGKTSLYDQVIGDLKDLLDDEKEINQGAKEWI